MANENINKNIKEYIKLFKDCKLQELKLEFDDFKLHLKKDLPLKKQANYQLPLQQPAFTGYQQPPQQTSSSSTASGTSEATGEENYDNYEKITSPIIGTFYRSSTPGADPFVKEGDMVSGDTTVCIVEAMKVMNEIKAELEGKIAKILVKNGDPVQAGQVMFLIEK